MATPIALSPEDLQVDIIQADCDQAHDCHWFETPNSSSSSCANRDSMICYKKRDDIFSPYTRKGKQEQK